MLDCPHQQKTTIRDSASGELFVECALVNGYIADRCGFVESRCKACADAPAVFEPGMVHNVNLVALVALDAKVRAGQFTPEQALPKMLACKATPDNCRFSMEIALAHGRLKVTDLIEAEKHFVNV